MGLRTAYIGTTGSDPNGERIRRELARRGVDVTRVRVRDAANPHAVILLDDRGERVVLWERSAGLELGPDDLDLPLIQSARLLHVDDVDEEAAIRAARAARAAGMPVTSDIERVTPRTAELVAAVTIPIFAEQVPEALTGERDVERALRKLQQDRLEGPAVRLKPDATFAGGVATDAGDLLCVTLGARGAMLVAGDRLYHEPAHQIAAVDTTGAGDVFRGAFIVALLRGDGPADILRFANAAAALSCTRVGAMAGVPTIEDTMSFVSPGRKTNDQRPQTIS
jgi:sugar/nucleoside kinase (ribokinase family)